MGERFEQLLLDILGNKLAELSKFWERDLRIKMASFVLRLKFPFVKN